MVARLADDFSRHRDNDVYIRYLNQITAASNKKKGYTSMVCEGLLNFFGTSSEEIIERTKKETKEEDASFYQPKIDTLTAENEQQSLSISNLSSQVDYLKKLLIQHNIPFNIES